MSSFAFYSILFLLVLHLPGCTDPVSSTALPNYNTPDNFLKATVDGSINVNANYASLIAVFAASDSTKLLIQGTETVSGVEVNYIRMNLNNYTGPGTTYSFFGTEALSNSAIYGTLNRQVLYLTDDSNVGRITIDSLKNGELWAKFVFRARDAKGFTVRNVLGGHLRIRMAPVQ